MTIRPVQHTDGQAIAAIYNHYIAHTVITFEESPVEAMDMQQRIDRVQQAGLPWLVAVQDNQVIGYAYASPWRDRSAYRFSVEGSIYLHHDYLGQGTGSYLFAELLRQLQVLGVHTVIAGIALPNSASVAMSERFGFRKVAHFHQVGWKHNRWIDVGYWQLLLGKQDAVEA